MYSFELFKYVSVGQSATENINTVRTRRTIKTKRWQTFVPNLQVVAVYARLRS